MSPQVAEVAVNVPLRKLFHYEIPPDLSGKLEVGHRVLVPFGGRTVTGVCVGFPEKAHVPKLKPIREVLHPHFRFDSHILDLTRWIAEYYHAGWGEVLEAAMPPPVRSGKSEARVAWVSPCRAAEAMREEARRLGSRARARARILEFLAAQREPIQRSCLLEAAGAGAEALRTLVEKGWVREEMASPERPAEADDLEGLSSRTGETLHPDQEAALEAFRKARAAGAFQVILLHGVTGSGKTEVYLRALRDVLASGRRGLILVPEISLTPQMVHRFRQGLPGDTVAVLHSMLGSPERMREWKNIQEGKARLVIGARSAVFAPVPDLGLIVVDEEHDGSYKQESSPRYSGRDVAVVRARMLKIPIILGSATPSLESMHNAEGGKYRLVELPRRVTSHDLPTVSIVPLTQDFYRLDGSGLISPDLDTLIRRRLREKEQVVLFLNRRGFATYLHCIRCGHVLKCPSCDISLTFHRTQNLARCHYCGYLREPPPSCPDCLMPGLRRSGAGTEKITGELDRRYEGARIARLDRDTAGTHRALRSTIARFARGEFDILVGTQMVAKGHDFPDVTLVGIINADTGLHFPDFRAAERTFQLITQVAGRAGRGARSGRVVIQTFSPEHFAIRCAAESDFAQFYRRELEFRRTLGYPPFGRIVRIVVQGAEPEAVEREARRAAEALKEKGGARILGPAASPIARIQGKYRHQILLKSPSAAALHACLEHLEARAPCRGSKVERIVDVDPQSML